MTPRTQKIVGWTGVVFMLIGIGATAVYINNKVKEKKD